MEQSTHVNINMRLTFTSQIDNIPLLEKDKEYIAARIHDKIFKDGLKFVDEYREEEGIHFLLYMANLEYETWSEVFDEMYELVWSILRNNETPLLTAKPHCIIVRQLLKEAAREQSNLKKVL